MGKIGISCVAVIVTSSN